MTDGFLISLTYSIGVESVVLFLLTRTFMKKQPSDFWLAIACIIPTMVTMPFIVFFFPFFVPVQIYIIFSEIFAVIAETPIIRVSLGLNWSKALGFSICANAMSFLMGIVTNSMVIP